jgi:hypothetical protein
VIYGFVSRLRVACEERDEEQRERAERKSGDL